MARDDPEARAIVSAVLGGDREAFRALVERESAQVVRACYRILGDLHDAEDAAQEAFVIAFRSLGTWRGDGPFGAWIARIGVRIALRQAARRKPVAWIDPVGAGGTQSAISAGDVRVRAALADAAMADSPRYDPAMLTVRGERDAEIRAAVARLEEPYRETVALRFFGERSLAEIATLSGRPLGTVKTHLHRALGRLRAELDAAEARP